MDSSEISIVEEEEEKEAEKSPGGVSIYLMLRCSGKS
jgi:hypothetical protein